MDPMVCSGNKFKEFRIQFWSYFRPEFLDSIKEAILQGDFGEINAFEGKGLSRTGEKLSFTWKKNSRIKFKRHNGTLSGPGYVVFHGKLNYWNINLIRNHPIFHMRGYEKVDFTTWGCLEKFYEYK